MGQTVVLMSGLKGKMSTVTIYEVSSCEQLWVKITNRNRINGLSAVKFTEQIIFSN